MATPLSRLHEIAAQRKWEPPIIILLSRAGPPHAPTFRVEITLAGHTKVAEGTSLRIAQQSAASDILNELIFGGDTTIASAALSPQPPPAGAGALPPPAVPPAARGIPPAGEDAGAPGAVAVERGPKSRLVEIASRQGWALTMRHTHAGPAAAAGPFVAEALLDARLVARGMGRSKADAERAAAAAALDTLGPEPAAPPPGGGGGGGAADGFAELMEGLCLSTFDRVCPVGFPRRTVVAAIALQVQARAARRLSQPVFPARPANDPPPPPFPPLTPPSPSPRSGSRPRSRTHLGGRCDLLRARRAL
jgi:hypothetical protein